MIPFSRAKAATLKPDCCCSLRSARASAAGTLRSSLFDSGFGFHDVVYVAGTAVASKLGDKLTNAPIGVVSEKGELRTLFSKIF